MGQMVRVYNKGTKPIVWDRSARTGTQVIHPGKYDIFSKEKAKEILSKFEKQGACTEEQFKKELREKKLDELKKRAESLDIKIPEKVSIEMLESLIDKKTEELRKEKEKRRNEI